MILVSLLVFMSCGEDFLDLKPTDAISDQEAFETLDDFHTALNGIYASMRTESYWGRNMVMNFDIATDDAYAVQGFSNQFGAQYAWTVQAGSPEVHNLWLSAYRVATRASNLINHFDGLSEGSTEERNQILGEAKLLRAMAHFDLVRVFAGPYVRSNPKNSPGVPIVVVENLEEKPRQSVADVYAFILEQANMASGLITQNRHRRYLGVDAVNAFLARVYHEMGDWRNAIIHAGNVIGLRSLSEGQQYMDLWRKDGMPAYGSDELIFVLAVHPTEASNTFALGANFVGNNPPLPPAFNWRVDYLPANELLALYDKGNDIRYAAFFRDDTPIPPVSGGVTVLVKHYYDNPLYTQRGVNQMKVFRLSELYLIRAEAKAMLGEETAANNDLSALRSARINGYVHVELGGTELIRAIHEERRKELAFEGVRWFDLRRRGEGFRRFPQPGTGPFNNLKVEADSYRWVWPIPQAEMDANTAMVQNAGYTGGL